MNTRHYDFSAFFADVEPPTLISKERTEQLKAHYQNRPDLDSFYILYDLRPPLRIKWSCNVEKVLGYGELSFERFSSSIHPEWLPIFMEITNAAYEYAFSMRQDDLQDFSYHLNIPIEHAAGHYIWVRHYSIPSEFDDNNRLVSHFSLYRYVEDYREYLQMRPMVFVNASRNHDHENGILRIAEKRFWANYCEPYLRPSEAELLQDYRKIIAKRGVVTQHLPTTQEIAHLTGRPLSTVKTYNHRVIEKISPHFPLKGFSTAAELAYLLEWTFGLKQPLM